MRKKEEVLIFECGVCRTFSHFFKLNILRTKAARKAVSMAQISTKQILKIRKCGGHRELMEAPQKVLIFDCEKCQY